MKARVLVVDDDCLVADTLCLIFRANGFESEARYTAATGFEYAKSYGPSLLLCDVIMPGESGLQLAQWVRESLPGTRLLLLTAYPTNAAELCDGNNELRDGNNELCDGNNELGDENNSPRTWPKLLSKPCRPDDLLRETRALLQMG